MLETGYQPTGTITFTLVSPGGTTVDTETITVNGNGSYPTPIGFTLPSSSTVTGTYQWNANYSGDTNNSAASDVNSASEQVMVNATNLTISTIPTLVSLGGTLQDTAVLAGGFGPTGSITFNLYAPGVDPTVGPPIHTETITVNGNGTYQTTTGFVANATGIWHWVATYGGDSNNNSVSTGPLEEPVPIVPQGTLTLVTILSPTTVTLGTNSVTLTDTALLAGGFNPTGTITFTLVGPGGGTVDTETVMVNGNGVYTTPTGFTLPTTGTITGTYQWNATYSGDTNNNGVSDSNSANEQVTVNPANPTLRTTPNLARIRSGPNVVILTDTAFLAGGYHPTGTIAFTLFYNGGSMPVDTETVTVNGNGMYTTPTGFKLPTTGTVVGIYQWNETMERRSEPRSGFLEFVVNTGSLMN
jgi:hypothetical protein